MFQALRVTSNSKLSIYRSSDIVSLVRMRLATAMLPETCGYQSVGVWQAGAMATWLLGGRQWDRL